MRILLAIIVTCCAGCASYRTPGGAVGLQDLGGSDSAAVAASQPAPHFPANVAVVRVQAPAYKSLTAQGQGSGRYSVVSAQELLSETQLQDMAKWPSVAGVTTAQTTLLPETFDALDDLRLLAAKVQADVLLVYTVSTSFRVQGQAYAPLTDIPLGQAPDRESSITSSASALFIDVRTGYHYGAAEATAVAADLTTTWGNAVNVDKKRLQIEQQAVAGMLSSAQQTWLGIAERFR